MNAHRCVRRRLNRRHRSRFGGLLWWPCDRGLITGTWSHTKSKEALATSWRRLWRSLLATARQRASILRQLGHQPRRRQHLRRHPHRSCHASSVSLRPPGSPLTPGCELPLRQRGERGTSGRHLARRRGVRGCIVTRCDVCVLICLATLRRPRSNFQK